MKNILHKGWVRGIGALMLFLFIIYFAGHKADTAGDVDGFYTNRGGYDDVEIPLLKPYFLIQLNRDGDRSMNLETNAIWVVLGSSINNIKKVNVVNHAILMYTPATHVSGEKFPKPAWAIIIPSKNVEEGFVDHTAYVNYLRSIGFKTEPELYDMKDVVKAANDNEVIDWSRIISN